MQVEASAALDTQAVQGVVAGLEQLDEASKRKLVEALSEVPIKTTIHKKPASKCKAKTKKGGSGGGRGPGAGKGNDPVEPPAAAGAEGLGRSQV